MAVAAPAATVAGVNPLRVADLDESDLLARVFPLLPASTHRLLGPGDDAAVLGAPDGRVVVSCDVLVEGHHFRREWSTGRDVGARAAAQNLADIAAMGARPTALVVGLVLPGSTEVAWVEDLARGLAAFCGPYGVGVEGGDLSGGEQIVVAVTVLGDLAGVAPVRRSGARPGDVVAHAGGLGWSAAGLAVLEAGGDGSERGPDAVAAVAVHRRPTPPLELGASAALSGATAMIDVSDGLVRDTGRIAGASGLVIDLDRGALTGPVAALAGLGAHLDVDPWTWVLGGGEDHGLLATFPPGVELPEGFTGLGVARAASGSGVDVPGAVLLDGAPVSGAEGWDHFGLSGGQPRR